MKFLPAVVICILLSLSVAINVDAASKKSVKKSSKAEQVEAELGNFGWTEYIAVSGGKTTWDLAFKYGSAEYPPRRAYKFISSLPTELDEVKKVAGHASPYIKNIAEAMMGIDGDGDNHLYLLGKSSEFPVEVAKYNNKKAVMFRSIASSSILNSYKLSAKQRASLATSKYVIPATRKVCESFAKTDIEYYVIFLVFGSKDFTEGDKDDTTLKPEVVEFITDKRTCSKFAKGDITDQEFADASKILFSTGDQKDSTKIKVVLE